MSIALISLISYFLLAAAYGQVNSKFSVYCTSNMDGTGKCIREDDKSSINCLIIPGGVIACRDSKRRKYSCVQYGLIVSFQSEFFCEVDNKNTVSDDLFQQNFSPDNTKADEQKGERNQDAPIDSFILNKGDKSTPNSSDSISPSYDEAF